MINADTIFIEAQRLFRKHKHGMDVVALELINRLRNNQSTPVTVLVKSDEDPCLSNSPGFNVHTLRSAFYPVWEQVILPVFLSGKKGLLHCTGNTAPVWGKMPLLVTIHDLIFLEENYLFKKDGGSLYQRFGNFYRSLVVPVIAKKAKHIITVSNFQRELIIKKLNVRSSKVSVIYNGADERFFKIADKAVIGARIATYGIVNPYILFLANTEPRKNTDGVIRAFARLCRVHPALKHDLVIKGLSEQQLERKIQECGAEDYRHRFRRVGYIHHDDLPLVYQGADVLWFPSFSEGFGLPIVEAMAGGVPVITSGVSVMPEIAGDAALYVDPAKPAELVAQTFSLFTNPALKATLVKRGKDRALNFTWSASADQLTKLYERMLTINDTELTFVQKLAIVSPVLNKKIS